MSSEALCARPECGLPIPPERLKYRAKYCSENCKNLMARNAHIVRKDEEERGITFDEQIQNEYERIGSREIRRQQTQLLRTEAKRREYQRVIIENLKAFEPTKFYALPNKKRDKPVEVKWGEALSDWQVGQYTPIVATNGMYEQTTEIAQKQLDEVWEATQSIFDTEILRGGKVLKHIWLNFIGDLVDGDCLRPAQASQIDRVATRQAIEVFDLAALLIRRHLELPGVEMIDIDMVGGNHDRTSAKAGNAGLGELDFADTYAFLISQLLTRAFANEPRVRIKTWESFFGFREFGGLYHAFEHGASFKTSSGSYGGVGWYPIMNAANGYIRMLNNTLPRVDMVWMGHFHSPAVLPLGQDGWLLVNGALPASSQFIQSSFKGLRMPQQWLVEFYPQKERVTQFLPLYANVGQIAKRSVELWRQAA